MKKAVIKIVRTVIAICYLLMSGAVAQSSPVQVIRELHHDVSPALRDMFPAAMGTAESAGIEIAATPGLNFNGMTATIWSTPDTNGAVGATQFVQWVNTQMAVYSKTTGAKVFGPVLGNSIFNGFSGECSTQNGGDGIVNYDKAAGRWIVSQRATPRGGPYEECVAVSTTSDATGSWNRYAFNVTGTNFPDYPKLSVWPSGYFLFMNEQNPNTGFSFVTGIACALNRTNMLAGTTATAQCFTNTSAFSLLPSDLDGATAPPTGSPNYLLGLGTNALNLWKFNANWTTPSKSTFTGPTVIPVAAFAKACNGGGTCIAQPGNNNPGLDSLGDRLMWRLAYRNFGNHESLVVNHAITDSFGKTGVRWYEVRSPGQSPTINQSGTVAPDSNYRWMGSIAMDKLGDMLLGYSISSPTIFPSIRITGRLSTDALGTMESEALIVAGQGSQTGSTSWGDYSAMTIDPVDDCTFWYTNEYYQTTSKSNWSTRIGSFKFPSCP